VLVAGFSVYLYAQPATKIKANPDGSVTVSFNGAPGATYRIEANSGGLFSSNWGVVADNVIASGANSEWVDAHPGKSARFYRVLPVTTAATKTAASLVAGGSALLVAATATNAVNPEASDVQELLAALNAGSNAVVLDILRRHGIAEATLTAMAARLGQPTPQVALPETFLRASTSYGLWDEDKTAIKRTRLATAAAQGYGHPLCVVRCENTNWTDMFDTKAQSPIGALDLKFGDYDLIKYFQWYDRYAEQLHSVALDWRRANLDRGLNTAETDETKAGLTALYRLIKARKPDAFVWVYVGGQYQWMWSLKFKPDGLLVDNLRWFGMPFAKVRNDLVRIVGASTPMVVTDFYGVDSQLFAAMKELDTANKRPASGARVQGQTDAGLKINAIGQALAPQLKLQEKQLQDLGFRGLAPNCRVIEAIAGMNLEEL
jgi:hypothetical protein